MAYPWARDPLLVAAFLYVPQHVHLDTMQEPMVHKEYDSIFIISCISMLVLKNSNQSKIKSFIGPLNREKFWLKISMQLSCLFWMKESSSLLRKIFLPEQTACKMVRGRRNKIDQDAWQGNVLKPVYSSHDNAGTSNSVHYNTNSVAWLFSLDLLWLMKILLSQKGQQESRS